jgi:hypothetical protein
MLLSPFSFELRLVVRLGVNCPELQPTWLAVHSTRFTAHAFAASGSRLSVLAHMNIVVTAFVYNYQVFILPVVMIAICMVEMYFLIAEKIRSTVSTCTALFSEQPCCNPVVEFRVSGAPVCNITIIRGVLNDN